MPRPLAFSPFRRFVPVALFAPFVLFALTPSRVLAQSTVRTELEAAYETNRQAYFAKDLAAIMALRHPDFHSITPDGTQRDRAAMQNYIEGILNGVERWIEVSISIDSLTVTVDTAAAVTRQFVDRMALRPDGLVHRVQTWVTQRETWIRMPDGWKMWRVDQLRDQRRMVDGKPG